MFGSSAVPLASWPKTKPLEGEPGLHITGKYVHPAWQNWTSKIAVGVWLSAGYFMWDAGDTAVSLARMLILLLFVGPLCLPSYYFLLRRNVDVKVMPKTIQVKGPLGYKTYSRDYPIEFRVDHHRKAAAEEAKEIEQNKKKPQIYRKAIEVVMQYGEQRITLTEMRLKDIEKAKALVIRLQNSCHSLDATMARTTVGQTSTYTPSMPTSDFGRAPDIR